MIDTLIAASPLLLEAVGQTLLLAAISIAAALVLGFFLAELSILGGRFCEFLVRFLVEAIRGIPILVFIFLTYYILPVMGIRIDKFYVAIIALAVFFSAFSTEIFRGSFRSISRGQTESGKAMGMSIWQIQTIVLLPQVVRTSLPALMNLAAIIIKATSLVSIIGVWELTLATNELVMRTMAPFTFFIVAMIIYFIICYSIVRTAQHLLRRMNLSQKP